MSKPSREPSQAGSAPAQPPGPSFFTMAIFFAAVAAMVGVLQYIDRPPTPEPTVVTTDAAVTLDAPKEENKLVPPSKQKIPKTILTQPLKSGMMTAEMLAQYDGTDASKPIMLALLGEIFDVTAGKDYYGPQGGYGFFSGQDGSRAFVSGMFNETGLIPDLTNFTAAQYEGVVSWRDFYHKEEKYKYVAKLIGHYYDEFGNPTEARKKVDEMTKKRAVEKEDEKAFEAKYPSCNSKWAQQTGGEVWCSVKSGGIDRDWVGVPRKFVSNKGTETETKKCVCLQEKLIDTVDQELFEVYPNCDPKAEKCTT